MIDVHLTELYAVETKSFKRAVKRNHNSFQQDFMFELTKVEYDSLRYHLGTLIRGEHSKYFHIAQISGVCRSLNYIYYLINYIIMNNQLDFNPWHKSCNISLILSCASLAFVLPNPLISEIVIAGRP